VILGHGIAKSAALSLLEELAGDPRTRRPAFILYPQRPLTGREQGRLRRIEATISARVAQTPEELTAHAAIALGDASELAGAADEARAGEASEHLAGRKVLLVDDDVRNLFALASLLEDRGLEVVFGESGQEALAALERDERIDLVLMDIMMPGMDGNETIAAIRRNPALGALPIIAVTAKAMEGDREQSLAAGASDYITKPVEPDRLLSLIGSWLRR
jgi:CheY-like chemotaxis protein